MWPDPIVPFGLGAVQPGQEITAKVIAIDERHNRRILSLRHIPEWIDAVVYPGDPGSSENVPDESIYGYRLSLRGDYSVDSGLSPRFLADVVSPYLTAIEEI